MSFVAVNRTYGTEALCTGLTQDEWSDNDRLAARIKGIVGPFNEVAVVRLEGRGKLVKIGRHHHMVYPDSVFISDFARKNWLVLEGQLFMYAYRSPHDETDIEF